MAGRGRHRVIAVTASPQSLAAALGLSSDPDHDETKCSYFSLQAMGGNAGIVYIGMGDTLTAATAYGMRIEIPVATVPSAPFFRESKSVAGLFDLTQWRFIGTPGDSLTVIVEYP